MNSKAVILAFQASGCLASLLVSPQSATWHLQPIYRSGDLPDMWFIFAVQSKEWNACKRNKKSALQFLFTDPGNRYSFCNLFRNPIIANVAWMSPKRKTDQTRMVNRPLADPRLPKKKWIKNGQDSVRCKSKLVHSPELIFIGCT